MAKELYEKETAWGTHTVTAGYGKNAGKFVAESIGNGGKKGYFKVFDTLEEAKVFVDSQTRPLSSKEEDRMIL